MPTLVANVLLFAGVNAGTALAVAGFVSEYGLLVGGLAYSSYKAKQAKRKAREQYNAQQVDRLVSTSSAVAPRELVLGRVRKAGVVFYNASTGTDARDFYRAVAIAAHEIDAVEACYLNDQLVEVDGSGNVTTAPYAGFAVIKAHLGAPGQTVGALLNGAFPAEWPSNFTVDGVAWLECKFTYNESVYANGPPTVSVVMRGAKLYDPRTGLTVWSDNPALMMRHVYQHAKFGKATVTAAEDARITTAANACDTSTNYVVGGVTEVNKLYRAALVLPFGTAATGALDDLAQAMGGSWCFAGGELYVKAGTFTASVMTLTDADLAVVKRSGATETQVPIQISVHKERAQKFNTVKAIIWDSGQDYKQTSLTPLVGSALLTRDGVELVQEITMPAVGYAPQALHVAGITMRDARDPLTVELPFKLRAYPIEIFDTVSLTLSRYGWSAKTFMVINRTWSADGSLSLAMKETTAAITQLDAGFLAQGFARNSNLPDPGTVTDIPSLTITSGTAELFLQGDGTVLSRMKVAWPTVTDAAVLAAGEVEVQYRQTSLGGAWASVSVAGNQPSVSISDVLDGAQYDVRARPKTSLTVGPWTSTYNHVILGKSAAPPPFDIFLVLAQPDGTRQYNFGYASVAAKPVDWLGAEIRYISGTDPAPDWDAMTPLQDTATHYTSSPVELNAPLAGAYTFACKSLDTTGNASAYLVRSLTLPDRRRGNVFDEFFEQPEGWAGVKTGCHVQDGVLEADDATTWATAPGTWAAWTRWNTAPASPIYYETPGRDLGLVVSGQISTTVDADGTVVQELATSANGSSWSGWSAATGNFTAQWIKLRLTVSASGPAPVPVVRQFDWQVVAPLRNEYINDQVISGYTGSYRIGTGDVRIPLSGSYSVLKRIQVVIQDSSAGTWSWARIDQTLTFGPRIQFRLNGTLADPAFVDFFVEGF